MNHPEISQPQMDSVLIAIYHLLGSRLSLHHKQSFEESLCVRPIHIPSIRVYQVFLAEIQRRVQTFRRRTRTATVRLNYAMQILHQQRKTVNCHRHQSIDKKGSV